MLAFVRSSGYIYVANGVLNITTLQSHVASGRVFGRCLHTQEYLPEVIGRIIVLNRR